jgi:hypothetical protein
MRAIINDVELYEDEFLEDQYEWDKNDVEKKIKALDLSDYVKNWLIENLPDYPAYH